MWYRDWDTRLRPWDFGAFLNAKRRGFVGREWLSRELEAWCLGGGGGPALLITGDPGAGKSALVAELVFRNSGAQVELLVVIAIVAILAAILSPVSARARARAQQDNCLSNIKQLVPPRSCMPATMMTFLSPATTA